MWRNDTKYKYMIMFPLQNLARKGLIPKDVAWSVHIMLAIVFLRRK